MDAREQFERSGVSPIRTTPDPVRMARLLSEIEASRRFDASLFLEEDAFRSNPQYRGTNPRAGGFNLLERLDDDFVLGDPAVAAALDAVLGDWEVMLRKVICGLPAARMPRWVHEEVRDRPIPNLGMFIRPEYRDITYFYGIDYHQDIIDFPDRTPDFVTLYYYIHPVRSADAPLHVLPGSHVLGCSTFPHEIEQQGDRVVCRNGTIGQIECRPLELVGDAGTCYFWHPCTLHGTRNVEGENVRLSLRYLIRSRERTFDGTAGSANRRTDLAADGAFARRGNFLKDPDADPR